MHICRTNGRSGWNRRRYHFKSYILGDGNAPLGCGKHQLILSYDLSIQCLIKVLSNGNNEYAVCTISWLLSDNCFLCRGDIIKPFSLIHWQTISDCNVSLTCLVNCTYNSPNKLLIQRKRLDFDTECSLIDLIIDQLINNICNI